MKKQVTLIVVITVICITAFLAWNRYIVLSTAPAALENISVDNAFVEMAKSAIKRESSNSSNLFQLPASIGGAGGAIKLKPGDLNSDTKTGGSGAGGKKKKGGCC